MRCGRIRFRRGTPRCVGGPPSGMLTACVRLTPTLGLGHGRGMRELPEDLESRLGYRIAYGEAARLVEMARFDHGWGKDLAAGIGEEAEVILKEVTKRVGPNIHPKLIKLAVEDAIDNQKP